MHGVGLLKRASIELVHQPVEAPTFRVLQWNVLADGLAQSGNFIKVTDKGEKHAAKVLEWENRLPLIMGELLASDADLLCLQEVVYFEHLKALLAPHGYEGVYLEKGDVHRVPPDGSALFYRTSRFQPESAALGTPYTDSEGRPWSQGCLQLLLRDVVLQRPLLLATTHLKAKAGASSEASRLSQVQQLLQLVQASLAASSGGGGGSSSSGSSSSRRGGNGNGRHESVGGNGRQQKQQQQEQEQEQQQQQGAGLPVEVVICGDFNATADAASVKAMKGSGSLPLRSIWEVPADQGSAAAAGTRAEFTTWKFRPAGEKKETIDYIWFSGGGGVQPVRRWAMPSSEEIGPDGLPCEAYPSDHLAVCCDFGWSSAPGAGE